MFLVVFFAVVVDVDEVAVVVYCCGCGCCLLFECVVGGGVCVCFCVVGLFGLVCVIGVGVVCVCGLFALLSVMVVMVKLFYGVGGCGGGSGIMSARWLDVVDGVKVLVI